MASLPPGPSWPPAVQLYHWVLRSPGFLEECAARYGDAFTVRIPLRGPLVVFHNPEDIKQLYTGDPHELYAGEGNRLLESLVGPNSLLLLDGERHARERKRMMPPFHGERMHAYGELIRDLAVAQLRGWRAGQTVRAGEEMQRLTLEVIIRAVFGVSEARGEELRGLLSDIMSRGQSPLVFAAMLTVPAERLRAFLAHGADGFTFLGRRFSLPWTKLAAGYVALDAFLLAEFARRRAEGVEGREDILSMLLAVRDEDGQPMSDAELRDELITLLVAGHETTANALSWALWHILRDAPLLGRLRTELDTTLGDGPLRPAQLSQLPLLDATIKESMRITPVIGLTARQLQRPMRVGRWDLPAGVYTMQCAYLTHHRPSLYPEPARFLPDRFLGKRAPGPFEFFPFGGGVRRCIGAAFATYEMKIILAEVLRRVSLSLLPGYEARLTRRNVVFAPSEGVPLRVDGPRHPAPTARA